jgi:ribosome modulation factor
VTVLGLAPAMCNSVASVPETGATGRSTSKQYTRLTIDSRVWLEGFTAGEAGRLASRCPYAAATTEAWSWHSGWIEGDAKRQGYSYSRGTFASARGGCHGFLRD